MSPHEPGSDEPRPQQPGNRPDDGGPEPAGGTGPDQRNQETSGTGTSGAGTTGQAQPSWDQPWTPPGPQSFDGQPYGGQTSGTSPYAGQGYGGQPFSGHGHTGPPYNGSPYNRSSYNGSPSGGFPYPGAPYGTSPYPPSPYGGAPSGQPRYIAPPKPGIIPLRPLMFGEILDGSFQAIRRNAKAMLGASLLAQSLSAILAAVLTGLIATSSGSMQAWARTASKADIASLGLGMMAGFSLLSIVSVFLSAVLQGAMVVPVARSILNRPTGFRRMLSLARPRFGALMRLATLLVAAVLATTAIFFLLIVFVFSNIRGVAVLLVLPLMMGFAVVAVWVAIKLMVAPAAVVIEELGAFAAVRRSWELTRANWWRILGISLVVGILVAVITQIVLIPASILPTVLSGVVSPHGGSGQDAVVGIVMGIVTAVIGALVGAVGYAFQTSVMALLYMDLRMRKDGLDIALLRQLESGADPDGIPGRGTQAGSSTPYSGYGPPPGTPPAAPRTPGSWPYGR